MFNTSKISKRVIFFLLCINGAFFTSAFFTSAKPAHNTVSLVSKWTWDEPNIDGTLERLWDVCPLYSYSIFSREGGNQSFYLQFLNNKDYLFIAISWSDNEVVQGDALRFYFDENHDGVLTSGNEDFQSLYRSSNLWGLADYHYETGSWVTDDNKNSSLAWSFSPTRIEVRIPLGNNAELDDLNSTFAGDSIGFNIIAIDSDFVESIPGYRSVTTEIYGNETYPMTWANLDLEVEPDLDFVVNLDCSSNILEVGEAFFVTCFVSNNANSTGIVRYLNVTLTLPTSIILAPTVELYQNLDELFSASTHLFGSNHTFIWTLIANETGEHSIGVIIDGVGIPQCTNNTKVNVVSPFPEINLISPNEGEVISGTFLMQVSISFQGVLVLAQYSLDDQMTWTNLILNTSSSFYETSIDSQMMDGDYITIRAVDGINRMTILTLNVSESQVISHTTIVTIDNTPPEIVVINPLNGSILNGIVKIQLSVNDGAGIDSVEFRIDLNSWISMTRDIQSGYYEYDLDTSAFLDGYYTIFFRASDDLGNTQSTLTELRLSFLNPESSALFSLEETSTSTSIAEDTEFSDTSSASTTAGFLFIPGALLLIVFSSYKKRKKSE